jgi:hypothetical protein
MLKVTTLIIFIIISKEKYDEKIYKYFVKTEQGKTYYYFSTDSTLNQNDTIKLPF